MVSEPPLLARQALLDGLAASWQPRELRDLASSLLKLADAVDQDWEPPAHTSAFRWPNARTRIEKNAANLALRAREIYDDRRMRKDFVPGQLLGEPAWDMLLDLFMQFAGGARVSVSSLCLASDCPQSTALRHIDQLVALGLIRRTPSTQDKRIVFVELTTEGVLAVGRYLERVS